MVNYPILSSFPTLTTLFPYLRFKAHLDHLMAFSLVYRGTRSWSWWHHQGLWHHYCDIRAHDSQYDPFSHHNLWTCTRTHTLHTNLVTSWQSPLPKSFLSSGLRKWLHTLLLTMWCTWVCHDNIWNKGVPKYNYDVLWFYHLFLIFGILPSEGPCKIKLTPQYDDYEVSKQTSNSCAGIATPSECYSSGIIPIFGVGVLWLVLIRKSENFIL